ncbi:MAG: TIGR01212 family radical SAM protein [Thomasclavelia sp.]|nr:TIGR01212 family radical SAM protein [Thomasclavelia sp.]
MNNNPFKYSLDNKRYHTFNYYLKSTYHNKVAKIALNADFTCPNRDGSKGLGGCIFCSNSGSGDYAGNKNQSIIEQYEEGKKLINKKWKNCKYIPYFQANTNTYGPLKKIQSMIEPFINSDEVVAISLATRSDSITDETINYLKEVNKVKTIWIELGLQTIFNKTSNYINRCETFEDFKKTLLKLNKANLKVCVHIINGLPFETEDMMIQTAKEVGKLNIQALKIHMLYVVKNTKLEQIYNNNEFEMLSREKYIEIASKQLEYIPGNVVIERLTGDGKLDDLIAPLWSIKKVTILNDIDKYMKLHNIYQGDKIKEP